MLVVAALALVAIAGPHGRDRVLVWNASASSPRGLYGIASGSPAVGDYVIAWPPAAAGRLAEARGYLPSRIPLVKTVAAGPGDRVCAKKQTMWVNGRAVAARRKTDRAGRRLPRWSGCRVLGPDEVLLLGVDDPASYDGRYFGPIAAQLVVGRARLLWRA